MAVGQQPPANCLGVQGQGTRSHMGTHTTSVGGHTLKCLGRCAAQVVSFDHVFHGRKELSFLELVVNYISMDVPLICRYLAIFQVPHE